MRAIPQLGRPLRALHALDDVLGLEAAAGDAVDRGIEHLAVVGELLRNGRRAGRHNPEHVAFVNQVAQHPLQEIARARRLLEVEVQVVDEEEEHASRRVVGRPARRQDDALLRGRRRRRLHVVDAPAVREHERHDVLLHAVLEDLELARLQIGHELVAVVADDDVGRDEVNADAEGRLLGRRLRLAAAAVWRWLLRRDATGHQERQCSRTQELSGLSHAQSIAGRIVKVRDASIPHRIGLRSRRFHLQRGHRGDAARRRPHRSRLRHPF